MGKNKEYTQNGVREYYTTKGCHSCLDCVYCSQRTGVTGTVIYECKKKRGKSSLFDRRFPYDNTSCKDFQEQSREG